MKMQRGPSLGHRYDSYMNYQDLFFEILNAKEEPLQLQLPNIWLWDTIDEFVYQVRFAAHLRIALIFFSYSCSFQYIRSYLFVDLHHSPFRCKIAII